MLKDNNTNVNGINGEKIYKAALYARISREDEDIADKSICESDSISNVMFFLGSHMHTDILEMNSYALLLFADDCDFFANLDFIYEAVE